MSGTDLKRLPVDRMLNVVEHLFEKEILVEKEIAEAREKIRAQMRDAFRLPDTTSIKNNSTDTYSSPTRLKEGDVDEFGRVIPKRREPNAKTKPMIPALVPSDDEDNPFPGLEAPLR